MNKKYELTTETKVVDDKTLYRIKALIDFGHVKAGDLGGFVESDTNLSHDGNAWIYHDAKVYGNAKVSDNAWVFGNAKVYGDTWVSGNACVSDNAEVCGDTWVSGDAEVSGNARATKRVLNINYEKYNITATDNHLKIGCQQHTFDEWARFDDDTIDKMHTNALVWWKKWKPIIFSILGLGV